MCVVGFSAEQKTIQMTVDQGQNGEIKLLNSPHSQLLLFRAVKQKEEMKQLAVA